MRNTNYNREALAKSMRRLIPLMAAVAISACSHSADLKSARVQSNFGVDMAQQNLWREAMFRFKRAIQINPGDAMAHNNLAVAFEANGDFEGAAREYREALRLDRGNTYIQKNYSRYTEFMSRARKRGKGAVAAAATPAPAGAKISVGGTATQPLPPPGIQPPVLVPVPAPPAMPVPTPSPKPPGGAQ